MTAVAKLPEPKYLAKLSKDGEWLELVPADDWTAEMWAHGTDPVYSAEQMLAALCPAEMGGVGADFDKWYGSCDARLWNNWDACKAAYIAGQKSKAKLDGVPPIREGENIHSYGARCFESGYAQASMLALTAAPAGVSEWQRVDSTQRAAEAVTEEMVEAGCIAMCVVAEAEWPEDYDEEEQERCRRGMRAALTAALNPPSAKVEL